MDRPAKWTAEEEAQRRQRLADSEADVLWDEGGPGVELGPAVVTPASDRPTVPLMDRAARIEQVCALIRALEPEGDEAVKLHEALGRHGAVVPLRLAEEARGITRGVHDLDNVTRRLVAAASSWTTENMEAAIERHVAPMVEDKINAIMTRLVSQACDQNAEAITAALRRGLEQTIERFSGGKEP